MALHRLTGGRRHLTERLTIEITETAAIHDIDVTVTFVDTLKELGCQVAIDDFGAGLHVLQEPARAQRRYGQDRRLVRARTLPEEPTNRVFIKTLVEIAQTFGLETVAEWVADEPTAQILRDVGVTHLQGFLYGQPFLARDYVSDEDGPQIHAAEGHCQPLGGKASGAE